MKLIAKKSLFIFLGYSCHELINLGVCRISTFWKLLNCQMFLFIPLKANDMYEMYSEVDVVLTFN